MRRAIALITLLPVLAHAPVAFAQAGDARFAATTLNVFADGEMKLPPDQATISLGVETIATTAEAAMSENANKMNRVIAALKSAGTSDSAIQTSQLNLTPQYAYAEGQPPRLSGYQASNQVTVTEGDLSRLGRLADAVVAAGANNVGQIDFGLANPVAAENSARVAAVKALEDKARLYADATGYRIGRLVNLTEGGGVEPGQPVPMMSLAAARNAAPTPVSPGELDIKVRVSGLFELVK